MITTGNNNIRTHQSCAPKKGIIQLQRVTRRIAHIKDITGVNEGVNVAFPKERKQPRKERAMLLLAFTFAKALPEMPVGCMEYFHGKYGGCVSGISAIIVQL